MASKPYLVILIYLLIVMMAGCRNSNVGASGGVSDIRTYIETANSVHYYGRSNGDWRGADRDTTTFIFIHPAQEYGALSLDLCGNQTGRFMIGRRYKVTVRPSVTNTQVPDNCDALVSVDEVAGVAN